jgi:hypothetical protein
LADGGAILGVMVLVLGGVVDHFVTQPFFLSLIAGDSFAGWSPLTFFLFLYGIPYAASAAAVAGVIAAIFGGAH